MSWVIEVCPNCGSEINMEWDVGTSGYKAFCPVCGKRLMLCDECLHREYGDVAVCDCDYNSADDTCRFNPNHYVVAVAETYTKLCSVYARSHEEAERLARYLNSLGELDKADVEYTNAEYTAELDKDERNVQKFFCFKASDYETELNK